MSTGMAALGSALISAPLVAALFCGNRESRMRTHADAPCWLLRHGHRIAAMGLLLQLALSVWQIGALAGPGTVLAGWMVAGSVFVAAINAWPRLTLRAGGVIGLAGLLLTLTALLA
jgi:hypothetical protein